MMQKIKIVLVWMILSGVAFSFVGCLLDKAPSQTPIVTTAELSRGRKVSVSATEVSDYVFGGYTGDWPCPPHADGNPKRAVIVSWKNFPFRFVFAHEGSYSPWFEFPSGAGHCFQFFEGNDGWAELFNDFGRRETNSFVEVLERGPKRVHVRWTYYGVNQVNGQRAYRGTEDFWAFPNGHVLRRQFYKTLMPGDHRGYTREPIEMIGMCPKGRLWFDVLQSSGPNEHHALAVLDAFSTNRYDVFWKHQTNTLYRAEPRRAGSDWKLLDDSRGIVLATPLREGSVFCVLGDAGGFQHDYTRIKEHSFKDTGGLGWVSQSWDHWPIGWLNSQANEVNAKTLPIYPNHFSPAGMDLFALPNEQTEQREFWSLIGVGGSDAEMRELAREWLSLGERGVLKLEDVSKLRKTFLLRD